MRSLEIKERNSNTLLLARSKQSELISFLLAAFLIGSIFIVYLVRTFQMWTSLIPL